MSERFDPTSLEEQQAFLKEINEEIEAIQANLLPDSLQFSLQASYQESLRQHAKDLSQLIEYQLTKAQLNCPDCA
jgi:hypothetical protein